MRVGFLTYGLDRAPTGIGRYAIELIAGLAALPAGPEVVLLTTEREDHHGLWQQFERHALPGCQLLPALMTIGNPAISLATRRHKLDVVHDPNGIAPFLGPRMGARRVVTIHDAFAYVFPETHNRLDNLRFRWQLPAAAARADVVVTDSENSRRDLIRYLGLSPEKVRATLLGVDQRFAPIPDGPERQAVLDRYGVTRPYLLYVGALNARKNIGRLLEAFALVHARHPSLTLLIGGKRQWKTGEIDLALQRLELGASVQFTGYLDDAALPALYSAAEAFVFPSLYEGFGLPPLEAMACGTPVITSNTSSLPEVVGDAALTVDPYDVKALATAMEAALTDSQLRSRLHLRGLKRAAELPAALVARKTLEIYEQLQT